MLDVTEARRVILSLTTVLAPVAMPVLAALDRVISESVVSDLDMPPFDKALMDGYAVRSDDRGERVVIEEIGAGQTPTKPLAEGQATRIMTGAPLPRGADAVIPHEKTTLHGLQVTLHQVPKPELNILRRASEYAVGKTVLNAGTRLRPQEIGVLASVGRTRVQTVPPPRVAVVATGDELVEPPARPGPGQLRNSNALMLVAQSVRAGATATSLGIARDTMDSLLPLIETALRSEVVILSGGVSAGKRDLVPEALALLGVTAHFHKVAMKPGKPFLFGTRGTTLVFGLPGNPVSSFVCFELFLRPALRRLAGFTNLDLPCRDALLSVDFTHEADRPTFHPARVEEPSATANQASRQLESAESRFVSVAPAADATVLPRDHPHVLTVQPMPWLGSADLSCLLAANALMVLPVGSQRYTRGDTVPTLLLD